MPDRGGPVSEDLVASARRDGVRIFVVALSRDAQDTLGKLTVTPSDYLDATTAPLDTLFAQIEQGITATRRFEQAALTDQLAANMSYVQGSGEPEEPLFDAATGTLSWMWSDVAAPGLRVSYHARPEDVGLWPTSQYAELRYTDGQNRAGRLKLPVPQVRVVAPTPTPVTPRAGVWLPALLVRSDKGREPE
jgi:hypothetical protein